MQAAIAAGLAGLGIEDTTADPRHPIHDFDHAVERVRRAAQVARGRILLTGRTDNFLQAPTRFGTGLRPGRLLRDRRYRCHRRVGTPPGFAGAMQPAQPPWCPRRGTQSGQCGGRPAHRCGAQLATLEQAGVRQVKKASAGRSMDAAWARWWRQQRRYEPATWPALRAAAAWPRSTR